MKRTIKSLAVAFALLAGISACTKETPADGPETRGASNLTVTIGYDGVDGTRAAQSSNVVPVTAWNKNIKSMKVLFVNGATITDVRDLPLETAANNSQITRTIAGVTGGLTYDVYILANYNQTTTPFGASAMTPAPAVTSLVGTNINSFMLNLVTTTAPGETDATGSVLYTEPSEVFIAKQTVTLPASGTYTHPTAFKLTRAVSLVRVRINQVFDGAPDYDNSGVLFTGANNANFRIRRHGSGLAFASAANSAAHPYGVNAITTTSASALNVLYSGKPFKTAADFTATEYGAGANMGLNAADYTLWNEYMTLPGGHLNTEDLKFNIVLGGMAPTGYVALEKDAAGVTTGTKTLTAPAKVYWTAEVSGALKPNAIIELNIKLKTQGTVGPVIPPVVKYVDLTINADLVNWDNNITYVPVNL